MVTAVDSLGAEVEDAEASLVVVPLVLGASEPLVLVPVSALADGSLAPASLPESAPVLSEAPPEAPESPAESAVLVWLALVLSELPVSVDPSVPEPSPAVPAPLAWLSTVLSELTLSVDPSDEP